MGFLIKRRENFLKPFDSKTTKAYGARGHLVVQTRSHKDLWSVNLMEASEICRSLCWSKGAWEWKWKWGPTDKVGPAISAGTGHINHGLNLCVTPRPLLFAFWPQCQNGCRCNYGTRSLVRVPSSVPVLMACIWLQFGLSGRALGSHMRGTQAQERSAATDRDTFTSAAGQAWQRTRFFLSVLPVFSMFSRCFSTTNLSCRQWERERSETHQLEASHARGGICICICGRIWACVSAPRGGWIWSSSRVLYLLNCNTYNPCIYPPGSCRSPTLRINVIKRVGVSIGFYLGLDFWPRLYIISSQLMPHLVYKYILMSTKRPIR